LCEKKTKYSFGAAISCSPEQGLCNRRTVPFEMFPMLKICHIIFFFSYPKSINCFALNWIFRILVASLMFSFSNS